MPVLALIGLMLLLPLRQSLPDFRAYEAGVERKTAFFDYLLPIVEDSNSELLELRERLLAIDPTSISSRDEKFIRELAGRYNVELDGKTIKSALSALSERVDTVPVSLALAQAAKESGWGTSRFAREGNNLFGEWCFEKGCGIVPGKRTPGRKHEVRDFRSPRLSIDSYLLNLNSHPAYREFRTLRKQFRASGQEPTGHALAEGLSRYSERGPIYVTEVRNLIRGNELE